MTRLLVDPLRMLTRIPALTLVTLGLVQSACSEAVPPPPLSRTSRQLKLGDQLPAINERAAIGKVDAAVSRQSPHFRALLLNQSADIVFKDEEGTGADRMMTPRLAARLARLSRFVRSEWSTVRVRVTEAWDEELEHGPQSAHYEGRAVDLTTSDMDPTKLGRLGFLAVEAGFDWVYFESRTHVHASVRK